MARSPSSSSNRLWWLAVPALLVAALYAWLSRQPVVPPNGAAVFYPSLILYHFTATALATAIALVAVVVLALWLPQALGRKPRFLVSGLAVLVALAASGLACWGTLPQTFTPYRHVDRVSYNGQVYQLGLRAVAATNEYYYVLCTCDGSGLTCHCRDLVATTPESVTEVPTLSVDAATGRFAVHVGEPTVYEFAP
jgi:hypothetical protein